ncbi:hypothetical protein FOL47_007372 [Perkinsus chesapeaki]|uniref:Uncharacterized protein n=1 Tax=Perkinsus chesapeaki TaxID=330153 RepID=A0A7J6LKY7_PERCH|nr:hypothetical protein FOL47_007372 [Perkinsus chesapeaki]
MGDNDERPSKATVEPIRIETNEIIETKIEKKDQIDSDVEEVADEDNPSDYDGDSEGSESGEDASDTPEQAEELDLDLFAGNAVLETEVESEEELLRRLCESESEDDDERSEVEVPSPAASSPLAHDTFDRNNIWKFDGDSPTTTPCLAGDWGMSSADLPGASGSSYLGTSLDEVLEFNQKCEASQGGCTEPFEKPADGGEQLEETRRTDKEEMNPDSAEAKNDAARRALELAIERYPGGAAYVAQQLLQNLTNDRVLIQAATYNLMIRAAEASGHHGFATLLYNNAGRVVEESSSVNPPAQIGQQSMRMMEMRSDPIRLYPVVSSSNLPGRGSHLAPMTRSLDAVSQHNRTMQLAAAAAAYRSQQQYFNLAQMAAYLPSADYAQLYGSQHSSAIAALELMYLRQQQQQRLIMAHATRVAEKEAKEDQKEQSSSAVPEKNST